MLIISVRTIWRCIEIYFCCNQTKEWDNSQSVSPNNYNYASPFPPTNYRFNTNEYKTKKFVNISFMVQWDILVDNLEEKKKSKSWFDVYDIVNLTASRIIC